MSDRGVIRTRDYLHPIQNEFSQVLEIPHDIAGNGDTNNPGVGPDGGSQGGVEVPVRIHPGSRRHRDLGSGGPSIQAPASIGDRLVELGLHRCMTDVLVHQARPSNRPRRVGGKPKPEGLGRSDLVRVDGEGAASQFKVGAEDDVPLLLHDGRSGGIRCGQRARDDGSRVLQLDEPGHVVQLVHYRSSRGVIGQRDGGVPPRAQGEVLCGIGSHVPLAGHADGEVGVIRTPRDNQVAVRSCRPVRVEPTARLKHVSVIHVVPPDEEPPFLGDGDQVVPISPVGPGLERPDNVAGLVVALDPFHRVDTLLGSAEESRSVHVRVDGSLRPLVLDVAPR